MKNLLALLFILAIIVSCDSDSNPTPPSASAAIKIDDAETTFTAISAADVGPGFDIYLKSSQAEVAIRLEGKTSSTYTIDYTKANSSVVVLTKGANDPFVGKTGTVTINVANGEISGSVDLIVENESETTSSITGSFDNLKIETTTSTCVVDKITRPTFNDQFRYDVNGKMTERRSTFDDDYVHRRVIAYFDNKIVDLIDLVETGPSVWMAMEYSGDKISKMTSRTGGSISQIRTHEYNSNGRLSKIEVKNVDMDIVGAYCFEYENNEITKVLDCKDSDPNATILFQEFDNKVNPYSILKTSLQNQDAFIYRFLTFAAYFSSHNILKHQDSFETITYEYEYDAGGRPLKITSEGDYTPPSSYTISYLNCK